MSSIIVEDNIEKIWEALSAQLKQFILKRTFDENSTEDILQEVFIKIHTHIDTLRHRSKIQSWVYQITRNAISDYYRGKRAVTELPEETPDVSEGSTDRGFIEALTVCVRTMIDNLPDRYRQALTLTEYQGLTQKEMGRRLGLSFSGAKSRVQRAREKLKGMLVSCCHFEFDRTGKIISYQPICNRCSGREASC